MLSISTEHSIHFLLAASAFVVVCIAALQAVLLGIQDYLLHRQYAGGLLNKFPPIEVMERFLFQLVWLGFFLLSLMLVSSLYFFEHLLQPPLLQKLLLTFITWLVFAVLLCGRYLSGWRGRKIVYCTLTGFFLLIIIYFIASSGLLV